MSEKRFTQTLMYEGLSDFFLGILFQLKKIYIKYKILESITLSMKKLKEG